MIYLFPFQTVQRPSTGGAGGAAERAAPPRRALQERGRQARVRRRPRRMPRRSQKGQSAFLVNSVWFRMETGNFHTAQSYSRSTGFRISQRY